MKKLLLVVLLSVLATTASKAQFYYGFQFGIYSDTSSTLDNGSGSVSQGGSSFNYTLKPSIGYYFTPRLTAGLKFNYTNCARNRSDSGQIASSVNGYAINLLMGNGLDTDFQSWTISPYIRYRLLSVISDKLNIWAELDGYYGMRTPRNISDNSLDVSRRKTIFGVELHPLISYDITDSFMLFTSFDLLSFSWDGTARNKTKSDTAETVNENIFVLQSNPLVAVAKSLFNIGLIRKF